MRNRIYDRNLNGPQTFNGCAFHSTLGIAPNDSCGGEFELSKCGWLLTHQCQQRYCLALYTSYRRLAVSTQESSLAPVLFALETILLLGLLVSRADFFLA